MSENLEDYNEGSNPELYHNSEDDTSPSKVGRNTPIYGFKVVNESWLNFGIQDKIVFNPDDQRLINQGLRSDLTWIIGRQRVNDLRKLGLDIIKDAVKSPKAMLDYLNCAMFSKILKCRGCVSNFGVECANKSYRDNLRETFSIGELISLTTLLEQYARLESLQQ